MNRNRIREIGTASLALFAAGAVVTGCSPEDPATLPHSRAGEVGVASSAPDDGSSTPVPMEGSTPFPAATPCDSASPGVLAAAAAGSAVSGRLASPIVIGSVACADVFAVGRTAPTDGRTQSTGILFRFVSGSWEAVEIGSAIDCRRFGVSDAAIPRLPGCR